MNAWVTRAALLLPALLLASCAASRAQGGGDGACPAAGVPAANASLSPAEVARQLPALKAGNRYRYRLAVAFPAREVGVSNDEGEIAATVDALKDGEAAVTFTLQQKGNRAEDPKQVRFPTSEPWRVALPPQELFEKTPARFTYAGSEQVALPDGPACAWRLDFSTGDGDEEAKAKLFLVPGVAVAKVLVMVLDKGREVVDASITLLEVNK